MVEQQSGLHILDVESNNHMKQKISVVISVQFLTWDFLNLLFHSLIFKFESLYSHFPVVIAR